MPLSLAEPARVVLASSRQALGHLYDALLALVVPTRLPPEAQLALYVQLIVGPALVQHLAFALPVILNQVLETLYHVSNAEPRFTPPWLPQIVFHVQQDRHRSLVLELASV